MENLISFLVTNSGTITIVANGKTYNVARDHVNYEKIKEAIKAKDVEELDKLVDIASNVKKFIGASSKVEVKDGSVYYEGEELHNAITSRILQLMNEDFPFEPMINFLANLMENPSKTSIDELYDFLDREYLPITEDGCFLAYKRVNDSWRDMHTNSIDNSIGKEVSMQRRNVDDNRSHDCSNGLHVGSIAYVRNFGTGTGHLIRVKVNPKDVVSVPSSDTNKMRVCAYKVLDEFEGLMDQPLYDSNGEEYSLNEELDATEVPF